mmetsp:Transcript_102297/g.248668  ORF Transcript_102297/g.248668 Transcript_102297/m.248668 type:complete len:267 (-) Transcript_102297:388-1188(-)
MPMPLSSSLSSSSFPAPSSKRLERRYAGLSPRGLPHSSHGLPQKVFHSPRWGAVRSTPTSTCRGSLEGCTHGLPHKVHQAVWARYTSRGHVEVMAGAPKGCKAIAVIIPEDGFMREVAVMLSDALATSPSRRVRQHAAPEAEPAAAAAGHLVAAMREARLLLLYQGPTLRTLAHAKPLQLLRHARRRCCIRAASTSPQVSKTPNCSIVACQLALVQRPSHDARTPTAVAAEHGAQQGQSPCLRGRECMPSRALPVERRAACVAPLE